MIFRSFVEGHRNNPDNVLRVARERNLKLYKQAHDLVKKCNLPDADRFAAVITANFPQHVRPAVHRIAKELYQAEGFDTSAIPPLPAIPDGIDAARYRDTIQNIISKLADPRLLEAFEKALSKSLKIIADATPAITAGPFEVPLIDMLPQVGTLIENFMEPLQAPYFVALREQYDKQRCALSRLPYTKESLNSSRLVRPSEADEPLLFIKGTSFEALKDAKVAWDVSEDAPFEGTWILAPQGSGKTKLIEYQISELLPKVARDQASIIVMDSQDKLVSLVSHLKCFAPGQSHAGRLVMVDPTDVEYPIALSLFDLGMSHSPSRYERERELNTALRVVTFILDSLLGSELTGPQESLFRFIMQLMFVISENHPSGANLYTFKELLRPGGAELYREYIDLLDGPARDFFLHDFGEKTRGLNVTKEGIIRRLNAILAIPAWDRMFRHARSKLSLFDQMNKGRVICINTSKDFLQPKGSEAFARFFLCLTAMSAARRATMDDADKLPCHVFLDEAHDAIGATTADSNFLTIIEQCRKQRIAITVAHQNLSQLSTRTVDTLQTVSVKFASRLADDAGRMARGMRTTVMKLERIPAGHFAAYVRDAEAPVTIRVPHGLFNAPKMTNAEFEVIRDANRAEYAVQLNQKAGGQSQAHSTEHSPPDTDTSRRDPDV